MADRSPKLVLDTGQLTENFFENSRLLGIMAPVKDYQFCWHLNNNTGHHFRINHDIEIKLTRKKRDYFFSVFEYCEPSTFLSHYVYNNQFDGEYLLPEFKHLDFLWLMKGDEISDDSMNETIRVIKSINNVQLVAELAIAQIKNKENLVF
ncbi:MAG: IPExxxVDY family protein [Sphingobacteriales bacterium]|nr:IPExxxVDY family protein [Sphingobacteriales bacterium]